MELGLPSSFNKPNIDVAPKIEIDPANMWSRISGNAIKKVIEMRGLGEKSDALRRIKEKAADPLFMKAKSLEWSQRVLNKTAEKDPGKEDDILIAGMVKIFLEMIDN